jgi:Acyl-CoA thioesterase C-terminal domain
MSSHGHEVARATAWRVQRTEAVPTASRLAAPPPLPGQAELAGPPPGWVDGYMSAIDIRAARGSLTAPGPGAFWGKMLYPLVPDEEPSPVERALVIADSGNGASLEIDVARWFSLNTELTVHLHREPVGEWICLDAQTTVSHGGTGIATSVLSDLDGPFGVGAQSLLIAPRPARVPQPA